MKSHHRLRHPVLVVPALVASYPAAFIWSANAAEVVFVDGLLISVLLALVGAAIHLSVVLLTHRRLRSSTSAVVAALLCSMLFITVLAAERLPLRFRYAVTVLLAVQMASAVWLVWRGGHRPGMARALTLIAAVAYTSLLIRPLLRMPARVELASQIRERDLFGGPILKRSGPASSQPDIYLIILDTWADSKVLRALYGVDDSAFRDSLRQLGFALPVVRANYHITSMTLASILNASYLDRAAPVFDRGWKNLRPLYAAIRDDRVTEFLQRSGYTLYFVPSTPWRGTLEHARARIHLTTPETRLVRGAWRRSVLMPALWPHTLLGKFAPDWVQPSDAERVLLTFTGTLQLIEEPGPKFVLAHSMAAHFPFAVDSACRPRAKLEPGPEGETQRSIQAYADGIRCSERAVLSLVTEILRRSRRPPVILLQGDHGPRSLGVPWTGDPAGISEIQAWERFGTMGAYYMPDGAALLPDSVTPVNVMRAILSHYVGADLPPLPDRLLFSSMDRPYRFLELPHATTEEEQASSAQAATGRNGKAPLN